VSNRLRGKLGHVAEPHREVGMAMLGERPIMYVEDHLGDEHDAHEVAEHGHMHKAAHLHADAHGNNAFLHIQPVDHAQIQAMQTGEGHNELPTPATPEQQDQTQSPQSRYATAAYDHDGIDDVIVHGGHTHSRQETEYNAGFVALIVFVTFLLSQAGIYAWKQYHSTSYVATASVGVWAGPVLYTIYHHLHNHRFIWIWLMFSSAAGYGLYAVRQKPLARHTPRLVYGMAYVCFHTCYGLALTGTVCMALDILGLSMVASSVTGLDLFPFSWWSIYLLLYGKYLVATTEQHQSIT
jgi:hypothetical protein